MEQRSVGRIGWLDVMKLLGLYYVYVVHYTETGRYGLFFFSILEGVLFFASGWTASRHRSDPLAAYAVSRFRRLMVPYFAFGFVSLAVRIAVLELSLGEILEYVRRLLYGSRAHIPVAALWFLPCLFCMNVLYHLLQRVFRHPLALLAVSLVISAAVKLIHEGPVLPWGADMAGRYLIYYALGDYLCGAAARHPEARHSRLLLTLAGLGTLVSFFVFYTNFYFGNMYFFSLFGIVALPFPVMACVQCFYQLNGIWCTAVLAWLLAPLPGLRRAGRSTICLCGAEQIVKTLVPFAMETVGLAMLEDTAVHTLINAALMLTVAYFAVARPVEAYFPWMLGSRPHGAAGEKG